MPDQGIFTGRDKELKMIETMISDPSGARHILRIVGEAGIGKTWLLKEIYRRYRNDPGILIVGIDYSETRPQSLPGLSLHVIEQFGEYMSEAQKAEYHQRMADWDKLLETELDPDKIRAEQNKIYHFGIDLIWQISQEKRTIVLSDALDNENALEDIQRTNLLAANLPNTVMIMAGRSTSFTHNLYDELSELYKRWDLHQVYELEPFSSGDIAAYFTQTNLDVSSEVGEKSALLTRGHPVQVALVANHLKQEQSSPDTLFPHTSDELQRDEATMAEARTHFERMLVDGFRALTRPLDRAVLYLAHLNRRYDPKLLQIVLEGETEADINQVIEEIPNLVYVRPGLLTEGGLLHQEAERLLKEYIWPQVDADGSVRQSLARKVIDQYYLPEIEQLTRVVQEKLAKSLQPTLTSADHREKLPVPDEYWPKRDLQMECLYYHFSISEDDGWEYLNHLFDEAQSYHYSLVQMDAIINAVYRLAPQQVDSAKFQVRVSQVLFEKGERQRAAELAASAVDSPDITPADAANGFIILADVTTDPAEKVTHFKVALEMAEAAEDPILELKIHNRLGLAYRRQGHWNEAEQAYLQVLRLLNEDEEPNQYAATLNNLAFVYMLNGNPIRADNLAEKALRMRREQGNIHGLGFSYSTKGRIAEAIGDHLLALRYHRTAVDLCELVGDLNNAALMQVNVSAGECHAQQFERAHLLLSRALRSELPNIRARASQQAARIDIAEGNALSSQGASPDEVTAKYEDAEQYAIRALDLATQVLDDHLTASVLLDLITIAYLKDQRKDEQHWQMLEEILKDHQYKLEKGRLIEMEGNFAYLEGDISTAFNHYLDACDMIASYSAASFRDVFEHIRDIFLEASTETQKYICELIQARYTTLHPGSPLTALTELCSDIIVHFD
jgi:tetratricopeptide (TPR) repeat protein